MTNPYSMGAYPQMDYNQGYIQPQPKRSSGFGSVVGMSLVGGIAGGTVGYFKGRNNITKNGTVSDSFAREAFENNVNKNWTKSDKKYFKNLKEFIAKLDKAKDAEGLKKILKDYKSVFDSSLVSLETVVTSLSPKNFKETKKVLKEQMEKKIMLGQQTFKNLAEKCWDKENKCFTKPEGLSEKIFNVIKNTKTQGQWKKALKYGGATAGVMGALTIGYKMLTASNR